MKRTIQTSRHRAPIAGVRISGFTLIELMVTITIAAILLGIAAPSMSDFIKNGRLTAAANDLLRSYQLARTEAIKRQQNVYVCASNTPTLASANCSGGSLRRGWIVFADADGSGQRETTEAIIESHASLSTNLTVNNDSNGLTGFSASGVLVQTPVPTLHITICDNRGTAAADTVNSYARVVLINSPTGRTRVSRTNAVVTTSVACP